MYNYENKLCKKCDISKKGEQKHTDKCTFNMGDECEGGIQCAKTLLNCKEPLTINRVTTDADGCLAEGIQSHYNHITPVYA